MFGRSSHQRLHRACQSRLGTRSGPIKLVLPGGRHITIEQRGNGYTVDNAFGPGSRLYVTRNSAGLFSSMTSGDKHKLKRGQSRRLYTQIDGARGI